MKGILKLIPVEDYMLPREVIDFNHIVRVYPHLIEYREGKASITNKNILTIINNDSKAIIFLYKINDLEKINWQALSMPKREMVFALMLEGVNLTIPLDHIKYLGKVKSFVFLHRTKSLVVRQAMLAKDL
jgi:hypothetical protein